VLNCMRFRLRHVLCRFCSVMLMNLIQSLCSDFLSKLSAVAIFYFMKGNEIFSVPTFYAGIYGRDGQKNCLCKTCKLTRIFGNSFASTPTLGYCSTGSLKLGWQTG
jgi:hypothetical protein